MLGRRLSVTMAASSFFNNTSHLTRYSHTSVSKLSSRDSHSTTCRYLQKRFKRSVYAYLPATTSDLSSVERCPDHERVRTLKSKLLMSLVVGTRDRESGCSGSTADQCRQVTSLYQDTWSEAVRAHIERGIKPACRNKCVWRCWEDVSPHVVTIAYSGILIQKSYFCITRHTG